MIVALTSLYKGLFVQKAMTEVIAGVTGEAVAETIEQFRAVQQELSSDKLHIVDIESDTWYAFHLANSNSWRRGLYEWAGVLDQEFPRRYLFSQVQGSPGRAALPFKSSARPTDEGIELQVTKLSGVGQTINKADIYNAFMETVRGTIKAYIRCIATGGEHFPDDYEGV